MVFIDANNECINECIKVTNDNKLTSDNIKRIVDTFAAKEKISHFSHLVEYSEVVENDYSIFVSNPLRSTSYFISLGSCAGLRNNAMYQGR